MQIGERFQVSNVLPFLFAACDPRSTRKSSQVKGFWGDHHRSPAMAKENRSTERVISPNHGPSWSEDEFAFGCGSGWKHPKTVGCMLPHSFEAAFPCLFLIPKGGSWGFATFCIWGFCWTVSGDELLSAALCGLYRGCAIVHRHGSAHEQLLAHHRHACVPELLPAAGNCFFCS